MRGRKPKPTRLRLIQGNPGKRPFNKREPKFTAGAPDCPDHLDTVAKKEWYRITAELAAQGLLTKMDRAALSSYCTLWSRHVKCERVLAKSSLREIIKGRVQNHGLLRESRACLRDMNKIGVEFGFTASSRTRIQATPTNPDEEKDKEFFG